jgi:hypothetical protein
VGQGKKSYYVNLDPAVKSVPFAANIDIRDTVNYKVSLCWPHVLRELKGTNTRSLPPLF